MAPATATARHDAPAEKSAPAFGAGPEPHHVPHLGRRGGWGAGAGLAAGVARWATPRRQRPQQKAQGEDRAEAQQKQIELVLGLSFRPLAIGLKQPADAQRVPHHEGVEFVHV